MMNSEFNVGVIRPIEAFKEGWEMIKDQFGLVLAVTFVGMLIGSAVPIVLIGPMMCGIYLILLQKYEGVPVDFAQLFKGFDFFLPSLILSVIIMVPVFVLLLLVYIPMIAITFMGQRMSETELVTAIVGIIAVELVFAFIMVCLHTLLLFSFPLIVDKRLSAIQAIKTSARAVWANLAGVAGLFGVGILVAIGGYMLLCIGIYLALPLIMAANVVAYRKVFPATAGLS